MGKKAKLKKSNPCGDCIGGGIFRTKTIGGAVAKNTVVVYENGVTHIKSLTLMPKDFNPLNHQVVLCEKFGKKLVEHSFAIKYSSLNTILYFATEKLIQNKIPIENVL